MTYCLHCGDCCLRMPPPPLQVPCQHIVKDGDFYFCGCNDAKPQACKDHMRQFHFCPIGIEKLGLASMCETRQRIDTGWEKCKGLTASEAKP